MENDRIGEDRQLSLAMRYAFVITLLLIIIMFLMSLMA